MRSTLEITTDPGKPYDFQITLRLPPGAHQVRLRIAQRTGVVSMVFRLWLPRWTRRYWGQGPVSAYLDAVLATAPLSPHIRTFLQRAQCYD